MVYKKRCNRCEKIIYSLSRSGSWICPGCGDDLSKVPVIVRDRSTANIVPLKGWSVTAGSKN